jgi:type I restriction enzyme S subunit
MIKQDIPKIRFYSYQGAWTENKISDIVKISAGGDVDKVKLKESGKYPVIANALTNKGIVGFYDDYKVKAPAVTVTGRGDVGYAVARHENFTPIVRLLTLQSDNIDVDYLENQINSMRILNESTGVPQLTAPQLGNYKVYHPEIEEQTAIGSLFRTLDDLLASYKENLANYQSLKATMLSKMFPKAGQAVPEIRLDGFEGEWKEKEFSKLVKRVTQSSDSDSLPKVEFEDIISGQGKLNKDISTKFDNRKGIHFKPGYTLYGKLRPYLNNWLLPKFEGVALGDFWVFDPNGNDSNFIYYLVQSNRYQKVANDTSGTKMPRSDWKSVSTTIFAIPQTIAEQQVIGSYFSNLDNLVNSHQEKISQLETLKKKLLQDMFI